MGRGYMAFTLGFLFCCWRGGGVVFVCVRMGAFLYKILCYMIAQGGQKRAFDSLEVELQMVVSCSVSARN